jgi:hypothetical protein
MRQTNKKPRRPGEQPGQTHKLNTGTLSCEAWTVNSLAEQRRAFRLLIRMRPNWRNRPEHRQMIEGIGSRLGAII